MKTNIKILFLSLFFSNFSFSQIYYSHYLDDTSEWRYYGVSYNDISQATYTTVYFDGTENHNNYTYYKRFFTRRTDSYFNGSVNSTYDSSLNYYGYNLVREDVLGNFYTLDINTNVEQIYFQSNLISTAQVGDIFPSLPNHVNENCNILTIDMISISGLNLKHIMALGLESGTVEGIGDVGPYCIPTLDIGGGLSCYTKQGQSIQFSNIDCGQFPNANRQGLSTNQYDEFSIKVYPNPATFMITVSSGNYPIESIEVIDVQGRILFTKLVNDIVVKIDLSNYQKGTYFLKVTTQLGSKVEKIIKN